MRDKIQKQYPGIKIAYDRGLNTDGPSAKTRHELEQFIRLHRLVVSSN